jgi:hypothetical protein
MLALLQDEVNGAAFGDQDIGWCSHPSLAVENINMDRVETLNRRSSKLSIKPNSPGQSSFSIAAAFASNIGIVDKMLSQHLQSFTNKISDLQRPNSSTENLNRQIIIECAYLLRNILIASEMSKQLPAVDGSAVVTSTSTNHGPIDPTLTDYLDQIFTPSLVHILRFNVPMFLEVLRANKSYRRPLIIWNSSMLSILRAHIENEAEKLYRTNKDDSNQLSQSKIYDFSSIVHADGYRSFHVTVADEVVADGVYLAMLLDSQHVDDIGARNLPTFVEKLQGSISSSKRVIDILQKGDQKQRRQSLSGKNAVFSQLQIKQKVLAHMIQRHPELGYSDLCVVDELN